jgi:hypothetical protein
LAIISPIALQNIGFAATIVAAEQRFERFFSTNIGLIVISITIGLVVAQHDNGKPVERRGRKTSGLQIF